MPEADSSSSSSASQPLVCVVGGDGVWGRAVVDVLTAHLPRVRVESLEARFDQFDLWLAPEARPDVVVLSCDDPGARVLSSCLAQGVAVVDLAWSLADVDAAKDQMEARSQPATVLAPVGWAGSAAAMVLAAAVAPQGDTGTRASHVDVDVLLGRGDVADDWWWRRFVNLHRTFVVWDKGNRRLARGLGEPKSVRFSDGRARRARRIESPEQDTAVESGLTESLSLRVAFERRRTDLLLAMSVASGAWRFLPASWRRKMLEQGHTATPGPHEFVVTADYPTSVVRARVLDPAGRAHLVAACTLTQVSRLLDPTADTGPGGLVHPEALLDPARDLEILRQLGVVVEVAVLT